MLNKTYAVFGLGRYGSAVAKELVESGAEVIAVDIEEKRADEMVEILPICKCADVTEADVIKKLGVSNCDTVIISFASNFEASIMATMLCKEAGVKEVIVKCSNELHRKLLEKVGADRVVQPEKESGIRLAKNLLSAGFVDIAHISEEILVVEIEVKDEWVGKNLIELDLRNKYSMNIIAIKQNGSTTISFSPKTCIEKGMMLVVVAEKEKLQKLNKKG